MSDTLVLNKSYIPVHIATWQKVMGLLYKDHAHALDDDYIVYSFDDWVKNTYKFGKRYRRIKTVRYEVAVPDIIVLTKYNRLPIQEVKFTRQSIYQRDKNTCQYCGKKFKREELTRDHVIPKSQGGKNTWNNLVTACTDCNAKKANRTPKQAGMKLIREPKSPGWLSPNYRIARHPKPKDSWGTFMKGVEGED